MIGGEGGLGIRPGEAWSGDLDGRGRGARHISVVRLDLDIEGWHLESGTETLWDSYYFFL